MQCVENSAQKMLLRKGRACAHPCGEHCVLCSKRRHVTPRRSTLCLTGGVALSRARAGGGRNPERARLVRKHVPQKGAASKPMCERWACSRPANGFFISCTNSTLQTWRAGKNSGEAVTCFLVSNRHRDETLEHTLAEQMLGPRKRNMRVATGETRGESPTSRRFRHVVLVESERPQSVERSL